MSAERAPIQAPRNEEIERTVLGMALIGPKSSARWLFASVPEDAFWNPAHRLVYRAARALHEDGQEVGLVEVKARLGFMGKLDEAGGEDYLIQISEHGLDARSIQQNGRLLLSLLGRRTIIERCKSLAKMAASEERFENVQAAAFDVGRGIADSGSDTYRTSQVDVEAHESQMASVPSGIAGLDMVTGGYYVGEPSVVVAPRGFGKTAWLCQSAVSAAESGRKVGYATLEMPAVKIQRRMVQQLCGWTQRPTYSAELQDAYQDAKSRVEKADILVYDPSGRKGGDRTIEALVAWAVDAKDAFGLDLLLVDYVQKLTSSRRSENRTRELDHIADELEWLAKAVGCAVVMASQVTVLNGTTQSKDSRRIEDNAALILYPKREKGQSSVEVQIGKNRHGREPKFMLVWDGEKASFIDAEYDLWGDS